MPKIQNSNQNWNQKWPKIIARVDMCFDDIAAVSNFRVTNCDLKRRLHV